MRKRTEYRVKNPTIEVLAMMLFQDDGEYACKWTEVSEETRKRYRETAAGDRPLVVTVTPSPKKEEDW